MNGRAVFGALLAVVTLAGCGTIRYYDPSQIDSPPPLRDTGPRLDAKYHIVCSVRSNREDRSLRAEFVRELEYEFSLHRDLTVSGDFLIGESRADVPWVSVEIEVVGLSSASGTDSGLFVYAVVALIFSRYSDSRYANDAKSVYSVPLTWWRTGPPSAVASSARDMVRYLTMDAVPYLLSVYPEKEP